MANTLLNIADIRSHLSTPALRALPIDLHVYIDSTNNYLKQLVLDQSPSLPRLCLAEQQTHGKGQADKIWHSPFGENIYLSTAFPFSRSLQTLEGFSLVTAIAVSKALTPFLPHNHANNLQIKWPNDVYYQGRKLAGILLETATQQNCVIVGIGINVNMQEILENDINQPWTSLALISGVSQNRNILAATIIEQFFLSLNLFEQAGFSPFLEEWQQYDFLRGKEVTLQTAKQVYRGKAVGINDRGQLLIEAGGRVSAHASGQLTVGKL